MSASLAAFERPRIGTSNTVIFFLFNFFELRNLIFEKYLI